MTSRIALRNIVPIWLGWVAMAFSFDFWVAWGPATDERSLKSSNRGTEHLRLPLGRLALERHQHPRDRRQNSFDHVGAYPRWDSRSRVRLLPDRGKAAGDRFRVLGLSRWLQIPQVFMVVVLG